MKRIATINRKTNETNIRLSLNIDGNGKKDIAIPVGFLTHMFDLFSKHGLFDIVLKAEGDTYIDMHHTVEDIGICLGNAFASALGDKKGISRYGFFILPMDEALATVAIDFCGRYSFQYFCEFKTEKAGDLETDLIRHFWDAFAQNAKCNLYIKIENGENSHHNAEAMFKAVARAIKMACSIDERAKDQIPSTKGVL